MNLTAGSASSDSSSSSGTSAWITLLRHRRHVRAARLAYCGARRGAFSVAEEHLDDHRAGRACRDTTRDRARRHGVPENPARRDPTCPPPGSAAPARCRSRSWARAGVASASAAAATASHRTPFPTSRFLSTPTPPIPPDRITPGSASDRKPTMRHPDRRATCELTCGRCGSGYRAAPDRRRGS